MKVPPPGWYPDPYVSGAGWRWWDGAGWTGYATPPAPTAWGAQSRPWVASRTAQALGRRLTHDPALAAASWIVPIVNFALWESRNGPAANRSSA